MRSSPSAAIRKPGARETSRETAYYTMFRGTAHVVLGSGLTIAGAMLCLSFTRLPYFQTMGVPCAVGTLVAVLAALTLGPAVIAIGSRFGLFEPKRAISSRGWRRIGTSVVRWPGPVLAATLALALIGLVALPGYKTNYDARDYLPEDVPANVGYAVADRHFGSARMNPELLMVESDHDLRNPADFLVIDKIAKAIFRVPGVSRVQTMTRPDGKPIKHTTIPFQMSMQGTTQRLNEKYMQDRMADMLVQADELQTTIDTMTKMSALMQQMSETTHQLVQKTKATAIDIAEIRDNLADFDDFFRPVRNYFYWEPHCYDIPVCWALRSVFDTLDGINPLTDDIQELVPELEAARFAVAATGRVAAESDRDDEDHAGDDADDVSEPEGHAGPDGRAAGRRERDGRRVRRLDERRHVLSAAGGVRQRRLQARHGELPVPGRQVSALHHQSRGRPGHARGHLARRRRSRPRPRKRSRAPRWKGRRCTWQAPPPRTRTCATVRSTTC